MNIKSSQTLVDEAVKNIETLSSNEVKSLLEKKEITLIDVRDIRELWKEGTVENSKHIPRGMLEFWLDPESSYYKSNEIKDIKKMVLFCVTKFIEVQVLIIISNDFTGLEILVSPKGSVIIFLPI